MGAKLLFPRPGFKIPDFLAVLPAAIDKTVLARRKTHTHTRTQWRIGDIKFLL
jgi:hypothetical protein